MSQLLRKALGADKLIIQPKIEEAITEEEDAEVEDQPSVASSSASPEFAQPLPRQRKQLGRERHKPETWEKYFTQKLNVDGFSVYRTGSKGPYVLFLHGAGHTAMSWALVSSQLSSACRIIAYDMRGHGSTQVENETDFSVDTLCADAIKILQAVIDIDSKQMTDEGKTPEVPKVVVVGHSMGGAIAVRVAKRMNREWLKGLVVVDVVEGTALEALPSMHRVISSRPKTFPDLVTAVRWAKAANVVRNIESAKISIPSQLVEKQIEDRVSYIWRTDLLTTEPYWKEWFTNLSSDFLSVEAPKMLMLAGTDRLDKTLTIGQMQGKFQLEVLPQAGHVIQEDAPEMTCERILEFMRRFRVDSSLGPPQRGSNFMPGMVGMTARMPITTVPKK